MSTKSIEAFELFLKNLFLGMNPTGVHRETPILRYHTELVIEMIGMPIYVIRYPQISGVGVVEPNVASGHGVMVPLSTLNNITGYSSHHIRDKMVSSSPRQGEKIRDQSMASGSCGNLFALVQDSAPHGQGSSDLCVSSQMAADIIAISLRRTYKGEGLAPVKRKAIMDLLLDLSGFDFDDESNYRNLSGSSIWSSGYRLSLIEMIHHTVSGSRLVERSVTAHRFPLGAFPVNAHNEIMVQAQLPLESGPDKVVDPSARDLESLRAHLDRRIDSLAEVLDGIVSAISSGHASLEDLLTSLLEKKKPSVSQANYMTLPEFYKAMIAPYWKASNKISGPAAIGDWMYMQQFIVTNGGTRFTPNLREISAGRMVLVSHAEPVPRDGVSRELPQTIGVTASGANYYFQKYLESNPQFATWYAEGTTPSSADQVQGEGLKPTIPVVSAG